MLVKQNKCWVHTYFFNVRAKDSCSVKLAVEEDNILCIVIAVSSFVNSVVGVQSLHHAIGWVPVACNNVCRQLQVTKKRKIDRGVVL